MILGFMLSDESDEVDDDDDDEDSRDSSAAALVTFKFAPRNCSI